MNIWRDKTRWSSGPTSGDSVVIPIEKLDQLSKFLDQVEDIRDDLKEMNIDVQSVKKKQIDILSSSIPDDLKQKEMDELITQLEKTSTVIRSKLKDIERQIQNDEQIKGEPDAHLRKKKTERAALLRSFMDSINEYQQALTEYRDRCNRRIKRQFETVGVYLEVENILEHCSTYTQGIISYEAYIGISYDKIEWRTS